MAREPCAPEASAWKPAAAFEPRRARALAPTEAERTIGERAAAESDVGSVAHGGAAAVTLVAVTVVAAPPALAVTPVRRALVVDDDPEVRRSLARFLRPELDVTLAGSVSEARAIVAQLDRLDVAFVDWELPDGTGEQILEWLSRWPDAIRVLISARFASSANPARGPLLQRTEADAPRGSGSRSEWPLESSSPRSGENIGERSVDDSLRINPLKNRALANLVLGKPVATSVIEALKRAALVLPND